MNIWDGKGSPTIGQICEAKNHRHGRTDLKWCRCEIVFLSEHYVILKSDEFIGQNEAVCLPGDLDFRPLKTKEQRAADKRLHEIRNALTAIHAGDKKFPNDIVRGNIVAATVEAMIDAGYRKFEIVEEDV